MHCLVFRHVLCYNVTIQLHLVLFYCFIGLFCHSEKEEYALLFHDNRFDCILQVFNM